MTMFNSLVNEVQDATTSGSTARRSGHSRGLRICSSPAPPAIRTRQIELFDEIFKVLVEVIELKTRLKLAQRRSRPGYAAGALGELEAGLQLDDLDEDLENLIRRSICRVE